MSFSKLNATKAQGAQVAQKNDGKSRTATSKKQKSTIKVMPLQFVGRVGATFAARWAINYLIEKGWNPAKYRYADYFTPIEQKRIKADIANAIMFNEHFLSVSMLDVFDVLDTIIAALTKDKVDVRKGDTIIIYPNEHYDIVRAA